MFVLEQNEYMKENIQWNFVDFGKDLQASIDLIENKSSPTGVLPLLDEESILPNSSDDSFFSKLISTWDQKSPKFIRSKLPQCFVLKHYAGEVEYNIEGWLSKNKDPLSECMISMLSSSTNEIVTSFFNESNKNVRGSSFRTASARHREQQMLLLKQLETTHPHFVRCIIPNNRKKAKDFDRKLILDQLRCNGVLEGIRIAREGYPNRIFFKEFFQRYRLLSDENHFATGFKKNCEILLSSLHLDPSLYKIGTSKLFFKAGVLAELETKKDQRIRSIVIRFNSHLRGRIIRKMTDEKLMKLRAARVLGNSFRTYNRLLEDPWYNLYVKIKPLVNSAQDITKTKQFTEQVKALEHKLQLIEEERDSAKEKSSRTSKDLEKIRSILEKERNSLKENENTLIKVKNEQRTLQGRLEEAISIKDKLEGETTELKSQYAKASEELEKSKDLSAEKEKFIGTLLEKKSALEDKLCSLETDLENKKENYSNIVAAKQKAEQESNDLKQREQLNQEEIRALKKKLEMSGEGLDIKLATLEKNCHAAKTRLESLVGENGDLRNKLTLSRKESKNLGNQLNLKEAEISRLRSKMDQHQKEIISVSNQRDELINEQNNAVSELNRTKKELSSIKLEYQKLEEEMKILKSHSEETQNLQKGQQEDTSRVRNLEKRLSEEISLNEYLSRKLSSNLQEEMHPSLKGNIFFSEDVSKDQLIAYFNDMKLKLDDATKDLEHQIEEKKDLIAKLRFTETRLASSSFDSQMRRAQLKKLKEIVEKTNPSLDLARELENVTDEGVNVEKLILEVEYLKRQLELETKAHYDAENVASALHEKFTRIQRVDSSSDIFKLKYEASEERVKGLEQKLKSTPLKDRTNIPVGDIFKNRESISKYEEDVKFHKLENYKLQENLVDCHNTISRLKHDIIQHGNKERLLIEQLDHLQTELQSSEHQKDLYATTMKQQKEQYQNCLEDLETNENQLSEYSLALKQAEDNIQSMSGIIENQKLQNKQKDKQIWEKEIEKNELDMELQEKSIELKKIQDLNQMLVSDIAHLKERLATVQDNSKYINEINDLKEELNRNLQSETALKKEVSTLNYELKSLSNESEGKISELLKQVEHYSNLANVLSNERDISDASQKELSKRHDELLAKVQTLTANIESLTNEKTQLISQVEQLRTSIGKTTDDFEKSLNEKDSISIRIKYLEETLELQREQNSRNGELMKKLQNDAEVLKSELDGEKKNNISLYEENQTLINVNSQLNKKMGNLEEKLSDPKEKDAWLSKIHELEELVKKETNLKYEEVKKTKNLERVINELTERNGKQTDIINLANRERQGMEKTAMNYNNHINELEEHIKKQGMDLKKCVRDNAYYQDRVMELEKEMNFWKEQYHSLNSDRKEIAGVRTEEVMM